MKRRIKFVALALVLFLLCAADSCRVITVGAPLYVILLGCGVAALLSALGDK